jgi:hypothetical protein
MFMLHAILLRFCTPKFRDIVMSYNLFCTIRRHHGRDIDGACGQLALRTEAEESAAKKQQTGCSGDIEDLGAANRTSNSTSSSSQKRANGSRKGLKGTDASQAAAAAASSTSNGNSSSGSSSKASDGTSLATKLLLAGAVAAAVLVVAGLRLRLRGDVAIRRR